MATITKCFSYGKIYYRILHGFHFAAYTRVVYNYINSRLVIILLFKEQ